MFSRRLFTPAHASVAAASRRARLPQRVHFGARARGGGPVGGVRASLDSISRLTGAGCLLHREAQLCASLDQARRHYAAAAQAKPLQQLNEAMLDGTSAMYVEQMYAQWKRTPSAVHASWDAFFRNVDDGLAPGNAYTPPPAVYDGVSVKPRAPSGTQPLPSRADLPVSSSAALPAGDEQALSELARAKFEQYDNNHDGVLDGKEIYNIINDLFRGRLPAEVIDSHVHEYMADFGKDKSSSLAWDEFKALYKRLIAQHTAQNIERTLVDSMRAIILIRTYAVRGHVLARTDPLGLRKGVRPQELKIEDYGWTEADLDRDIFIGEGVLKGFGSDSRPIKKLREIVALCERAYCGEIGVEFMHNPRRDIGNWIRQRFETLKPFEYTGEQKKRVWDRLAWAQLFEQFLSKKFQEKRFGLDGGESFIPGVKALVDRCSEHGVESITIGMAHRGRLNVLANVVRKPLEAIFCEFQGRPYHDVAAEGWSSSGDVKYHLGTSYDRPTHSGRNIHLSLVANPSHLEAVNPLVEGKTFAKQYFSKDTERSKSMSLLVHGDASFSGQGVVYETLEMVTWPTYHTGGTVHVIINNQIGFTTNPPETRLGQGSYCSDVAKGVGAPIFHVNGDNPLAVCHAMELAADFRAEFGMDVVVDVVCYRRYGHNEVDQPKFTQPLMYHAIDMHPTVLDIYTKRLVEEGVVSGDQAKQNKAAIEAHLDKHFQNAVDYKRTDKDWLETNWVGFFKPNTPSLPQDTGISRDMLNKIGAVISNVPDSFKAHKNVKAQLKAKAQMFATGEGIDWATAEALAFGSLALEGDHVRLSGQDVERGTFSHRHAVLHDQESGESYMPLANLDQSQAPISITNSSLSEFAVLGFETGFSLENPRSLVCWEAQFGDFVNGAQIIIDQFIASGEQKWKRQCGVTLLLPHGYEGAGPEHSSARPERFLFMSDADPMSMPDFSEPVPTAVQRHNLQVVYCSTPANYFHVLRRQQRRDFRKPLVIFTPKSLLRHREAVSPLVDFTAEGDHRQFRRMLPESEPDFIVKPRDVKQLILCTGKVFYELRERRRALDARDTAIVRVEQFVPFPWKELVDACALYPNATLTWVQEEPFNMGFYPFVMMHVNTATRNKRPLRYVGRAAAAAPATGNPNQHKAEVLSIYERAFDKSKY